MDGEPSHQQCASKTTCDIARINLWLHNQDEPVHPIFSTHGCSHPQSSLNTRTNGSIYQTRKRKRNSLSEDLVAEHNFKLPFLPLTEGNLKLLTRRSLQQDCKMFAKSTSTATIQGLPIGDLLTVNRMPLENYEIQSRDAYRAVMETSNIRIARRRHSPERDAKANDFKFFAAKYKYRNEQTFIEQFFLPLTKGSRNVLVKDDRGNETKNSFWKERAWAEDGMDINISQPFLRSSLPKIDTRGNKHYEKVLDSHERIKNPNPDRCYGLAADAFTEEEQSINRYLYKYIGISSGIYYPSIVIEFGLHKSITELESQCARGGAALVNAIRSVRATAGENIMVDGADQNSLIYSFAISGDIAYLHVNWAFVEGNSTTFHMHLVKEFSLRRGPTIMEMRGTLNNLLDWTVGDRKTWIKGLLQKINVKGKKIVVPTPITLESSTDDGGVVMVEDEDEGEGELASDKASGGATPNKNRKNGWPAS